MLILTYKKIGVENANVYQQKRKKVNLQATRHAYTKFVERFSIAFPNEKLSVENISDRFEKIFSSTSKVKNLSRQEKTRLKRHGEDTIFFRTMGLTFIVQNAKIVTVELSNKNTRHLNRTAG